MKGLVKEDGTTAQVDEKLNFKVIEFNKSTKRIVLSHTRTFEKSKKEESKEKGSEADMTQKAVKKIKANLEKTTLGDISELAAIKSEMENNQ